MWTDPAIIEGGNLSYINRFVVGTQDVFDRNNGTDVFVIFFHYRILNLFTEKWR